MSVGLAVAIILGAMVLLVGASMLIEQGGTVVQRIRLRGSASPRNAAAEAAAALRVEAPTTGLTETEPLASEPVTLVAAPSDEPIDQHPVVAEPGVAEPVAAVAPEEPDLDEPAAETPVIDEPAAETPAIDEPEIEVELEPAASVSAAMAPIDGLGWGALTSAPGTVTLRDPQAADTMVGVLLGAYIDGGGPAAKRASAWVTVRATPPSLDGEAFAPGADLRNRTGRVRTLFAATDLDATWITLRTAVDIERGLKQSPLSDPTLDGLLIWWRSTRAVPAVIPPTAAARLAAAIASVDDRLDGHPWAEAIGELHATLVTAAVEDQDVLVGFASGDVGPMDDEDGGTTVSEASAPADAGTN
ncbi:MAG: hypothetical protein ACOYML_04160 [Microthrixaceae bacterium]